MGFARTLPIVHLRNVVGGTTVGRRVVAARYRRRMDTEYCLVDTADHIMTVRINRPDRLNALHPAANAELGRVFDHFATDDDLWVAIITGEGRGFSAGNDLRHQAEGGERVAMPRGFGGLTSRFDLDKPVIAAVNGVAAGAGANIALACDLVVARESAAFIQAFSKIGLIPDSGGTWMLPRLVGMQRAAALAFLGNRVSASEAAALGMIYRAVADAVFEAEVDALAVRLAALPTRALGLTKRAFNAGWDQSLSDHLTAERDLQIAAAATADYAEGVAAFLEKRPAHFTGA